VFGRKQWILFPPSDTSFLYPTRLPYEESSVFSQVDILRPDMVQHPRYIFNALHKLFSWFLVVYAASRSLTLFVLIVCFV